MAQINVSSVLASGTLNLTALGTADWLYAGTGPAANANARKNVAPLITIDRLVGTSDSYFDPAYNVATWSDGTPNASGSSSTAKYVGLNLQGGGFIFTVPAGTGPRTYTLAVGMYNGPIRVSASLSDGSATMADVVWNADGVIDQRVLTFVFAAASEGQMLTIRARADAAAGAVHFLAAALSTPGVAGAVNPPGAPTIGTAIAGDGYIDVAFSAPASDGGSAILDYTATTSGGQTATGTSSPIRVTVPNGSAQNATVKARNTSGPGPASAASNSVTPTVGAGGAPGQVTIADSKVVWSPGTWDDRGSYKVANAPGAYAKLAFTGVSVSAKIDVSNLVAAAVAAGSYPTIRSIVDGYSFVDTKLTSGTTTITRSGLSNGAHTVEFHFIATDPSVARWDTDPINAVRIAGFAIDTAGTLTQAASRPKVAIFYSDSTREGWAATGLGAPAGNNSLYTDVPIIAQALNAEYGSIAYSGQGYPAAGGDVPKVIDAWDKYSAGRSRLVAGKFATQPDYIFIDHGANGGATQAEVAAVIAAFRAAAPNAWIFVQVAAGGFSRSAITAAANAARATDPKIGLIDLGAEYQAGVDRGPGNQQTMNSIDGLHKNLFWNARVAGGVTGKAQQYLDGVLVPNLAQRSVSLILKMDNPADPTGAKVLAANLQNLAVSFYDESSIGALGAVRYQSTAETTDAAGAVAFQCGTTLAPGTGGRLIVEGPAGIHYNGPATVA